MPLHLRMQWLFLFQRMHSAAAAMQAGAPEQPLSRRIIYLNFPLECG